MKEHNTKCYKDDKNIKIEPFYHSHGDNRRNVIKERVLATYLVTEVHGR